jgi:hypothetical protein
VQAFEGAHVGQRQGASRQPAGPPAPPWDTVVDAVVWLQPPSGAARAALPLGLRRQWLPAPGVAGVVAYRDSPVGPYRELFAGLVVVHGGRPRLHVPVIAVDSAASLDAGRAHWALPKTLAHFTGSPETDRTVRIDGAGLAVRVAFQPAGPAVPLRLRGMVVQVWEDGTIRPFAVAQRGRGQLARARVTVDEGAALGRWLQPGTHRALVLHAARVRVLAPRRPAG